MRKIDLEQSKLLESQDSKYEHFKEWLRNNGGKFEDVHYPSVFQGGLIGISAKTSISTHKCFIAVPHTCIISVARVLQSDLKDFFAKHPQVFSKKHPDHEQLILASFLVKESLIGKNSFWYPYLQVMNTADLVSNWQSDEIKAFRDAEIECAAELYKQETESEWLSLKPLYEQEPMLAGATRELFLKMYNLSCTRCFGWTLPSTMMVPFADFLNHLPVDT